MLRAQRKKLCMGDGLIRDNCMLNSNLFLHLIAISTSNGTYPLLQGLLDGNHAVVGT